MQPSAREWQLPSLLITFVTSFLLVITSISALANGKGYHQPDEKMSEHMKLMQAVREEIPEEFRIMERTPILPDEDSLQRGSVLFLQSCSVCHGKDGDGKGPAAAALSTPPANFLDDKHSSIYGPGEKFWIIGNGTGQTGMPAFSQFSPVDRWNLVNHILQLQEEDPAKPKEHGYN